MTGVCDGDSFDRPGCAVAISEILTGRTPGEASKVCRDPNAETDLAVARRVIRAEIAGLESLAAALDEAFQTAVEACAAAARRIIVTGGGKSGHARRKIAPTPASTRTPAQFPPPRGAWHRA